MDETLWWPLLLGVLGLVFGSFIATVAIRWPAGRTVLRGRSACDGCGRTLRADELVPVASYLLQQGACRSCGKPIHPAHLIAELAGLGIGVASGFAAPGIEGVIGACFGWLLLTLAMLDLIAFWLPNELTAALALAGIATGLAGYAPPLGDRLIGGVAGYGVLWLVAAGYRAYRGRQGLGGGDPKLFGAIGLWLGWHALPTVLLGAALIGLAGVLGLRLAGRKVGAASKLPFGVMLAMAAWGAWLGTAMEPPHRTGVVTVELMPVNGE